MSDEIPAPGSIAIIGLAGRFPGAPDLAAFWQNLRDGVESIRRFSREELLAAGLSTSLIDDPKFVPARSVLENADFFDAEFFHIQPREAELLDPQQRVLLELAWEAFENAGYDPAKLSGPAGVFAGASLNTYFLHNLCADRATTERFATDFQTAGMSLLLGTDKDYLATRIAYKLNLKGPAITVQTACSTSLVAVCQAVQALLSFQCDTALAGGVSIAFPQTRGHVYDEGSIGSADGHCRAFDAQAGGTVFGSGAGLVLLKRLEDALADGDHIHAVIRGCAVNNDGADKVSYTAPSVAGQAEVITLAHALAGVSADSISYVEAHGTATPLGDPIEVAALTQAFRATTDAAGFCALGTVKSNLGHLESASGVAGLIKTTLALQNEELPATLHFTAPNPKIAFAGSPFRVLAERESWPRTAVSRRAGVSSFGVGGTNAHVVLEEAPVLTASAPSPRRAELLILSARSPTALEAATKNLAQHLEKNPALPLADVAYTLQIGRRAFNHRRILFALDSADAVAALRRHELGRVLTSQTTAKPAQPITAQLPALAQRWLDGEDVDWPAFHALSDEKRQRVPLPSYPFERQRFWIEPPARRSGDVSSPEVPAASSPRSPIVETPAADYPEQVRQLLQEISGLDLTTATPDATLFELGFDSLVLTQAAHEFRKRFGVKITFRQLLEDLTTLGGIAEYVVAHASATPQTTQVVTSRATVVTEPEKPVSKPFGPYKPIERGNTGGLTERQQSHLDALIARTLAKTPASKRRTQATRREFADPRSVSGFRAPWKEMVYPIITTRSLGARFWDVDGNEYLDVTMGFGTNLLGHAPEFITNALHDQLTRGIEVGPQSPLAGEVAQLMCELTGHERTAFCNTGSEAVLAAVRIARTVTGRTRIATCGGFHGINDEVLVRAATVNGEPRGRAVAPGIPDHIAREVMVLEYGTEQALDLLQTHAHDLAAILIEPVQSRRPDLQPRAFLEEARRITQASGTALIFDEVINGFRIHLGGAQSFFGVKSDISTWGKIIGGGMPIGAVTGSATYLDALDGGFWQFGDDSFPEVGVTFFAGTYVRHPLAMAASRAILRFLKEQGPSLQQQLGERTGAMVGEINAFAAARGIPLHVEHCASLFYFHFPADVPHGALFWFHLREKGLHIWEGRPCFLSTAHTEADIAEIIRIFKECLIEMQRGGFLPGIEEPEVAPASAPAQALQISAPAPAVAAPARVISLPVSFSLYFFGHYPAEYRAGKYDLLFEAAKFADAHDFEAIWLPERHFHAVGGFSPNPSLLAAALARETKQLQLRAGSVVLPLHHPMRVAEEWSVVDNLAPGRVGLSIASGWHPNDFIFAPDAFESRRELNLENLATIRRLWSGESVEFPAGNRVPFSAQVFPQPSTRELPVWLTCIHHESFEKAGELGLGVVGYLMNQTLEEVATKVAAYRAAYARAGHDPAKARVTILLHTFVGADRESARRIARGPLREYLRSFLDNSQKRHEAGGTQVQMEAEDMEYLLDRAFEDYAGSKALLGSPESCAAIVENLSALGVDEIGCFLDFGVDPQTVLASLPHLVALKERCENKPAAAKIMPMTEEQRGVWASSQLGGEALRAYNESTTLALRGPLNAAALQQALQQVVDRHEALRTTINEDGETLTIHPHLALEIPLMDVAGDPAKLAAVHAEFERGTFDFHHGPILKAQLLRLGAEEHQLTLSFHHLLGNGPSYWIFFEDLVALYEAAATHRPPTLEPALQLSTYLNWRTTHETGAVAEADQAFWREELAGELPPLELPRDHARPPVRTFRGGRCSRTIEPALTNRLREAGAKHRCSLFMTLSTAHKAWLARLSGQDDFIVGVPSESAVRELPGGPRLFADTTNMLPLRTKLDRRAPFHELLAITRSQVLASNEHQECFFGSLLSQLDLTFEASRPPVFAVTFNYETGLFKKNAAGVDFEFITDDVPYRNARDISPFELVTNIAENHGVLLIECDFNADLFDLATVERWLGHYATLLEGIANDPTQPIGRLPLLSATERTQMLAGWNDTARDWPEQTIHAAVQEQAARTPNAIAAECAGVTLTYAALETRAESVAAVLLQMGARPGVLVGLCVERSLEMLIAVLAILKTGAAYVPLDPALPAGRVAMMIEDAQITLLVTQTSLLAGLPPHAARTLCLDEPLPVAPPFIAPAVAPTDLAYVIFTSGSTGRPKGVMVPHRGVVSELRAYRDEKPGFTSADVMLAITTLSFDPSVVDLFLPLLAGGKVVIASAQIAAEPARLIAEIERSGATMMQAAPVAWRQLIEHGWKGSPKLVVLCGAEPLTPDLAARLLPRCAALWNQYGPTETTIWCSITRVTSATPPLLLGGPIANGQLYILDAALEPQPPGVTGEIYVGGLGVTRGYIQRPELTAEKFIADPFGAPGQQLYRTGDLAAFRPDGAIEFRGRADHQIKLRGFRIEIGEIEAVLRKADGVRDGVVIHREDRLVAFYAGTASAEALRTALRVTLPDYMVPARFVALPSLPLNTNGKIDRRLLTAWQLERESTAAAIPLRPGAEQAIGKIWSALLEIETPSAQDDFFASGGHSLLAIRLLSRIKTELKTDISIQQLFHEPTIAGLARLLKTEETPAVIAPTPHAELLVEVQAGAPGRRPLFLIPGGGGGDVELLICKALARHIDTDLPILGIRARGWRAGETSYNSLDEIVTEYVAAMRSAQPKGPYLLAGQCLGCSVAIAVAHRLEAEGEELARLLLIGPTWRSPGSLAEFYREAARQGVARFWNVRVADPARGHWQKWSRLRGTDKLRYLWSRFSSKVSTPEPILAAASATPTAADATPELDFHPRMFRHVQAILRTPLTPYPGKVALLIDRKTYERDGNRFWPTLAAEVEYHVMPGDELSYLREHAAESGRVIRECLQSEAVPV